MRATHARRRRRARLLATVGVVSLLAGVPPLAFRPAAAAPTDVTTRLSVTTAGAEGNDDSGSPSISEDGRFVAFSSTASNLGPPDERAPSGEFGSLPDPDVFVRDRSTGTTTRASLASDGTERNASSTFPAISGDGRHVAFTSWGGLTPGDTDGTSDIYSRDLASGTTTLLSAPPGIRVVAADHPTVSRQGRWVGYEAHAVQPVPAVFVTPSSLTVSRGEALPVRVASVGAVPATVRRIAVEQSPGVPSPAVTLDASGCAPPRQLAPGESCDVTITGAAAGSATLIVEDDGIGSPHTVQLTAFVPTPPRLTAPGVCCSLRMPGPRSMPPSTSTASSARTAAAAAVSAGSSAPSSLPSAAASLQVVSALTVPRSVQVDAAAPGVVNTRSFEITNPTTAPIRVTNLTLDGSPEFRATGCAGLTLPPNGGRCTIVASIVRTGRGPQAAGLRATTQVVCSQCFEPFETTGPVVLFAQDPLDTVLVADRDADANGVLDEPAGTATFGLSVPGDPLWAIAREPSISADGRWLAFQAATDLIAADTNARVDVYVTDLDPNGDGHLGDLGPPVLASVSDADAAGNGASFDPSLSADGHAVAFTSGSTNLVAGDGNGLADVFVRTLTPGATGTARASVTTDEADANGASTTPTLSADGRSVAFSTTATNLGATGGDIEFPDTEIVLRDLVAGTTTRVSVASGDPADPPGSRSVDPAISANGRYVAFASPATSLVAGDNNRAQDVFVRDRRPVAALSPNPLDFGDQPLRQTSDALPLEIRNAGTGPLVVGAFSVSAVDPAEPPDALTIDIVNPCLEVTLFSGETCQAEVRVTANVAGQLTATLTLDSPDAAPALVQVVVNGAVSALSTDPTAVNFGEVPVSTDSDIYALTLANVGTVPLRLTGERIDGADKAEFGFAAVPDATPCPGPDGALPPGATCTLGLVFRPDALGIRTASLVIDAVGVLRSNPPASPPPLPPSDAPDRPFTLTVPLTGIGLPGGLAASPNPADFGGVPVGTEGRQTTVTVRVVGRSPIRVGVPALSGLDTTQFRLDATGCAGRTLPVDGSCRLVLRLAPNRIGGPITASVLVPSVDIAAPLDVKLVGSGRPGGLAAAPNPARFGAVPVGQQSAPVTVTVRVLGASPVRLGTPAVSGVDAPRFGVDSAGCAGRTLPVGGSCRLVVRLTPNRLGPVAASVSVPSVDLTAPLRIRLSGTGGTPTLDLDPPIGPPGTVVHVTGTGYPPNALITLSWQPGLGGEQTKAGGGGAIDDYVLVFRRDQLGPRQLTADGSAGVHVQEQFLVVPPAVAPPKFINDR